jgi:hypothetical protein
MTQRHPTPPAPRALPPPRRRTTGLLAALAALLLWLPAAAGQPLSAHLSDEAQRAIDNSGNRAEVQQALKKLERSDLPRKLLRKLVASKRAASYLPASLPRLADLGPVEGLGDVVKRLARSGRSGAYELAVVHAFRGQIGAASAFVGEHEVDGLLASGTIIESKSGKPKRPDHILTQVRRRAAGGKKVALALNYRPTDAFLGKLRALSHELGGRLEVQYIPLNGRSYETLVAGRRVEAPRGRTNVVRLPTKSLRRKARKKRSRRRRSLKSGAPGRRGAAGLSGMWHGRPRTTGPRGKGQVARPGGAGKKTGKVNKKSKTKRLRRLRQHGVRPRVGPRRPPVKRRLPRRSAPKRRPVKPAR